jgi:hypothetical protein
VTEQVKKRVTELSEFSNFLKFLKKMHIILLRKPEGREFETQWGGLISSIYLILSPALGPGVHSASKRN